MFARLTRLTQTPDRIEETISSFESDIVPSVRTQPGYGGIGLAADRSEGSAVVFTLWETREAMDASEATAAQLRGRVEEEQEAHVQSVERFEVAHFEGSFGVGTFSRVVSAQVPPDRVGDFEHEFRDRVLPVLKAQPGFCRASCYVNRETGSVVAASGWQTAADRDTSEGVIAPLRTELSERLGSSTPLRVELYELVYADVRAAARTSG